MNPKNSLRWVILAAVMFAALYLHNRFVHKPDSGPVKVLPGFRAADVDSVQVLPKGQPAIHAERTNEVWRLTDPDYPALAPNINALLAVLQVITAAPYIPASELKGKAGADEQFGFASPQASLLLGPRKYHLVIGDKTALGDQVFVQVVGVGGVFVVDAELLRFIPRTANDWRETALADWNHIKFDRVVATNAGRILDLQYFPTNQAWRMTLPIATRADRDKVGTSLQRLAGLQAREFTSDDPKSDLDAFGLQSPELTLAFFMGTNNVLLLEFGKSPTNDSRLVYARRHDQTSIVAVARDNIEPWLAATSHEFRDFLDHRLLSLPRLPDVIEVAGAPENFTLEQQTNGSWRILPENLPADPALMQEFLTRLVGLRFVDIEREIVLDPDLPAYGLKPAARQFILKAAGTNSPAGETNSILARLDFGIHEDKVYARNQGEDFVYSIKPADLKPLSLEGWQMRDRQIWRFSETNVARLVLRQEGRTREILRYATNSWSLAPGSQGDINDLAMEEVAHQLGDFAAVNWIARGDTNREQFGFSTNGFQIEIELRDGRKLGVELGGFAQSGLPYATTRIGNEDLIFEFSPLLYYKYVRPFLSVPPNLR